MCFWICCDWLHHRNLKQLVPHKFSIGNMDLSSLFSFCICSKFHEMHVVTRIYVQTYYTINRYNFGITSWVLPLFHITEKWRWQILLLSPFSIVGWHLFWCLSNIDITQLQTAACQTKQKTTTSSTNTEVEN